MQKKTALAAAGALVLTVAGGVSVLSLTGTPAALDAEPTVITQYVDQYGNPIDPLNPATAEPTVIYVPAEEPPVSVAVAPETYEASGEYEEEEEYEPGEYEESEYEEDYEEDEDDD